MRRLLNNRFALVLAAGGVALAVLYLSKRIDTKGWGASSVPPAPPWFAGSWKGVKGGIPTLDLAATEKGGLTGQLVMPHADDPGYQLSEGIVAGEHRHDAVLFAVPAPPGPHAAHSPLFAESKHVLYLLKRTGNRAELYKLKDRPGQAVRLHRDDPGQRILFPTVGDGRGHPLVATLVRSGGGGL